MGQSKELTKKELQHTLDVWKERFLLFNWEIKVEECLGVGVDEEAEISIMRDYLKGTLKLPLNWRTWSKEKMNEIIVHELVHLIVHHLRVAADDAGSAFSEEAETLFAKRLNHELEGAVDHISKIAFSAWGDNAIV